ncbi:MAG: aromatic/alkene monooxygenase hydroxylase subunit beta [Gammaproteobacteria bacterium]|nr:aromatic/alkene monooxygenase hydroxylase subunit beta [Gammaproteobacteria bacterium]
MQIDLRTVSIEPQRQAFDHLIRRFGDKPASRYQEGSYDIQAQENLHYKPTWAPDQELYDPDLSKIKMADWYAFKDPRQYYYSSYTLARARQQETAEANFDFIESRGLAGLLPDEVREQALQVLMPLRHAAWGANLNNTFICGYGYGTTFTQPCLYYAMDCLGIAQYLSKIGLMLGDVDALKQGKDAWMNRAEWQSLRRYTEDCLVNRDPFEVFVAQNIALDGLLYPLIYKTIVEDHFATQGGQAVPMLTQFMSNWFDETKRWSDSVIKIAAAESEENKAVLQGWAKAWSERAVAALLPVVALVYKEKADEVVAEQLDDLKARLTKTGLAV